MTGSLRALLEAGAAKTPDKVVVSADGIELTWSRLHEQACRVAAALVRDGVGPQDRVIYLGKNDPRYFEVLFGCALAGAVLTPLNWRLAADELAVRRHGRANGNLISERDRAVHRDVDHLLSELDYVHAGDEKPNVIAADGGLLTVEHRHLRGTHDGGVRIALDCPHESA